MRRNDQTEDRGPSKRRLAQPYDLATGDEERPPAGAAAARTIALQGAPVEGRLAALDEHVLRLQVAVEDAVGVAPREAVEHLVRERLDALAAQLVLQRLHVLLEVEVAVLEAQVELALLRHVEHVLQLDDVRVVELLEERHLAQRRARHALVLALELDLLERRDLAGLLVRRDVHLAEGALAELLPALPHLEGGRRVHGCCCCCG